MTVQDMPRHRLVSQSFYKNKKLLLGQMSFIRGFANNTRGDLHPLNDKTANRCESKTDCTYHSEGGSFVTVDDERLFVCGNDFSKRANYCIYSAKRMFAAEFDFDGGGFRGWAVLSPYRWAAACVIFGLPSTGRMAATTNWSYGNIYCFEGIM